MGIVEVTGNDPLLASWVSGFRSNLRGYARSRLPEAMVPAHFVVLPSLPKLPNGKVDRAALPALVTDAAPDSAYVAPRTPVETQLARIWQDLLGLPQVGVETSFFDLGGDSLTVMQMAGRIREAYDVRVDLRRLLEEPTVARLARMVGSTGDPMLTGADNPRGLRADDLRREAVLPEDVVPEQGAAPAAQAPYRTVLLTGGTGYTGAFLLRELLDRSAAQIHVLVRADSPAEAADRVRRNLDGYGLWHEGDERRIRGVAGDTGRPYLGLSREAYRELATGIEMIVHNAADSRWTVPYAKAKPVNVLGTVEVLRLACRSRIKPVHYICSTGAYPGLPGRTTWAEIPLRDPDDVSGGYRQTKWVADRLVTQARERGLPTHVYRPGALTGAQGSSGACSTDTFINHLIKGWIQLGSAMRYDFLLELVPVDYCAAAVAHIALGGTAEQAIFNLPGARSIGMDEVVDLIIECGYPLRRLPYREWHDEFTAAVERGEENELAPYVPLFDRERPAEEIGLAGSRPVFETANLDKALAGSGIECRPVDRELIDRYLRYFVSIGYLPPPPRPLVRVDLLESDRMTSHTVPDFPMARTHPLDPPPRYREFLDRAPVFQVRTPRGLAWLVARHEDCAAVLTDPSFSSDPRTPGFPSYMTGDIDPPPGFFLQLDPPDQTRLRRLVTREFLVGRMEALRPGMQRTLDRLVDDMLGKGPSADLVGQLAFPMAATVICDMLSVPFEDHDIFVSLTDTVLDRSSTPEQATQAAQELMAYFDRLVTAKEQAATPTDDLFGRLIAHADEGRLSHVELVGLAALLLLSGYDTMAQMIGLGVLTLLRHPDQLAQLKADPGLVPGAIEELLRYLSINHSGLPRAATKDVVIGGQPVRAGEGVLVMLNQANRDDAVFDRPDTFDIHRTSVNRHLAFGHGFHKCIGLTLARVELATVVTGLLERIPTMRLAVPLEDLRFRHDMVLYGVRELPVAW